MDGNYNYYAVKKGRIPGIYTSWSETKKQVDGYNDSDQKGFNTLEDALKYLEYGDEYREEVLLYELEKISSISDFEILKQEIVNNFENFTNRGVTALPSELHSRSILTPQILKKIGVDRPEDLVYIRGAFKVNKIVDLKEFSKQFITTDNSERGGYIVLSGNTKTESTTSDTSSSVETPENWYNYSFPPNRKEFLYHRGHAIAKSFKGYTRSKQITSLINKQHNIFVSTNWMNHGNHDIDYFGVNQTYIENSILKIITDNPKLRVNYRVELIFHEDENVPRGIHIMAEFLGKVSSFQRKSQRNTLNVFIPNIDPRFIVDYKREA
ncbi:TPA: viroplasmin family protein [Streptococcus suis]|nr:viroplasmin family protein [Streptococcus suis]